MCPSNRHGVHLFNGDVHPFGYLYFHAGTSTASIRNLRIEKGFDAECGFLIGTFTPSIRLIFNLVSIYSTNL